MNILLIAIENSLISITLFEVYFNISVKFNIRKLKIINVKINTIFNEENYLWNDGNN